MAVLLCALLLPLPVFVEAQSPNIDELAKTLTKDITKAKFKSVLVADFVDLEGKASPEGMILASKLTNYWNSHKEEFSVFDRQRFDIVLAEQKLTFRDLIASAELMQKICTPLNLDAIVNGTVILTQGDIRLDVFIRHVGDSSIQTSAVRRFSQSDFPPRTRQESSDLANTTSSQHVPWNAVRPPACLRCPAPEFPPGEPQGTVLLNVAVVTDGHAADVVVLRAPSDALARKAVEAVGSWKFKPAEGPNGKPINAKVQIEITFHR